MKAYKITYMRIGYNEPWAGWKIAGKSIDIPYECTEDYFRIQSANSNSSVVKEMYDKKMKVWEYCIIGKNIYLSRLIYGINDQSPESRISMRADGVIYAIPENNDLAIKPQFVLNTPITLFENVTNIEWLYPELLKKNAPTVGLSNDDVLTRYESINVINDNTTIIELTKRYFPNFDTLKTTMKCVIWALTEKSNPSISIVFSGTDEDKKNIIFIITSLLPISLRSYVSFRTFNIPGVKPLKFIFTNEKAVGRYLDVSTGENNIIKENKLDLRYEKYDYITYPIEHIEKVDSYFDLLYSTMEELGDSNSIDLNFLKIAHDIVLDEYLNDYHEMSNQEILKKFLDFISIPMNNEKIDWYCAKLLETIIDNNIPLNDVLKQRLKAKLKTTKSDALKTVGYSFDVINMLSSENTESEYAFLFSLKSDQELFSIYRKKILENKGGSSFLDAFYGTYYGEKIDVDYESILSFINETKDLQVRYYTDIVIEKKLKILGENITGVDYSDQDKLRKEYKRYRQLLDQVYSTNEIKVNIIISDICKKYWSLQNIKDFDYQNKDIYEMFYLSDSKKCQITRKIIKIYDRIPEQETDLPIEFKTFLALPCNAISLKDREFLIIDFRKNCVSRADDTRNIEFWYNVADLERNDFVQFIITNKIKVFVDEDILCNELCESEFFSKSIRVDILLVKFESYNCSPNEKQIINEIVKCIKEFQRIQKKEEREQAREKEKEKRERLLEERDREKRDREKTDREKKDREKKNKPYIEKPIKTEQQTDDDYIDVEMDFVGGITKPANSNQSNVSQETNTPDSRKKKHYKEEKTGGIKSLFNLLKRKK